MFIIQNKVKKPFMETKHYSKVLLENNLKVDQYDKFNKDNNQQIP